jgi:hypothetical protein
MYACTSCSKRYCTISAIRYPEAKWAKDDFFVQTYIDLDDPQVAEHTDWWVGEWLEIEDLSSVNVVVV